MGYRGSAGGRGREATVARRAWPLRAAAPGPLQAAAPRGPAGNPQIISDSRPCVLATPRPRTGLSNPTRVAPRTQGHSITAGPLAVSTVFGGANPWP